ncbi:hypothetical protein [Flavobacterium sp. N3904]|uniref:hypothetical protein n=1 Tax=Flavobacterium sp. N3904 TaxID=2986835 RepID=UPI0022250455|nr:hypothetical protein [Flavobacterium sp. N3904]
MKAKYIIILFSILFCNCTNTKEETFLENFPDKEEYESNSNRKPKEITSDDLYFLNRSEAINEFESEIGKNYYYGYKTKTSNDCYLILYGYTYRIDNNYHPFALGFAGKSYLCIYQKGNGIVSKLKISTNDPIQNTYEEKTNIYTIKTVSAILKYDELKNGFFPYRSKDTIVSKYKIENNRFVKINSLRISKLHP